jgi:hypothetical protein
MTVSRPDTTPTAAEGLRIERWAAASGSERGSRASLVIHGGGHRWRAHAEGNGAVDALMRAVDVALAPLLGEGISLATYDVHASAPGHEAKASVSLSIRASGAEDGPLYPGRFVSENVLEASVGAYVDAVNALLADTGVDIASAVPSPGETNTHDTDPEHRSGAKDRIMSAYNH